MKKLAIIFLCVIMTLSLLACGSTGDNGAAQTTAAAQTNEFSVGFGRVESTPSMGISLQGYDKAADRKCTSVLDPLYITCVAIRDDQGNTAILITSDSIRTEAKVANSIRRKLEEKYGIPQENTFFTSTHSHSTPDSMAVDSVGMAVEAADKAIADLKAAKMYIGTGKTDNLNFVRHYIMDDGSIVGDNYGDPTGKTYVKHETEADNEIRLIKFTREGQKDIVMMNWQVHPLITGGPTNTEVSADIVGACRMTMEKELDCYVAYFSGASGNHDFECTPPEEVKRYFRLPDLHYFFDCKGYRIIAFDPNYNKVGDEYIHYAPKMILSLEERDWIPPEQVQWLRDTIDSSPYPCILIGHGSLERPDGIHNREEILELIRQANRKRPHSVLMVINGHYHRDHLRIIDNVVHFEINSTSYEWGNETHQLYPQELRDRVRVVDHCIIYNDPVHAIVTLEGTTITIDGMESSFYMGIDRKKAGWSEYDEAGRPCTPTVLSAKLTLH